MGLPTTPPISGLRTLMSATVLRCLPAWNRLVSSPYQLALRPASRPGLGRMAGVHSTLWILAMTAALIRRATLNSRLSSHVG